MSKTGGYQRGVYHGISNGPDGGRLAAQYWSPDHQYRDPTSAPIDAQIAALEAKRERNGRRLITAARKADMAHVLKLIGIIAEAGAKISLLVDKQNRANRALISPQSSGIEDRSSHPVMVL